MVGLFGCLVVCLFVLKLLCIGCTMIAGSSMHTCICNGKDIDILRNTTNPSFFFFCVCVCVIIIRAQTG